MGERIGMEGCFVFNASMKSLGVPISMKVNNQTKEEGEQLKERERTIIDHDNCRLSSLHFVDRSFDCVRLGVVFLRSQSEGI